MAMMQQPRFMAPPPRYDGGMQPRMMRYPPPPPASGRFRPPGFAGQINDGRQPRPWTEHRPGYTPSTFNSGKQAKKSAHRKTIDYNATVLKTLQNRIYLKDSESISSILPDALYVNELTTPSDMVCNPMNCVVTKFVRQSTNKIRCPIFCVAWTPEGRRLITGASSGEFTLWNGLTFNFETILQAHNSSVRAMIWSHDDNWMMTADHDGYVKYWQSNMNNVKMFQAHKDPIRGLSFCPTDSKFASCSDDGSVKIFDFVTCVEEKSLKGHGADVKCVDWHPQKSIIISGSKDSQQPIKLWDARTGQSLATIHAHKSTVMSMRWNRNGNWFLTASRDHLLKLFDIRNMRSEFQTFRGHQKEATVVSWHPIYEDFFASGGSDGSVKFWSVGIDKEVGSNDSAHEGFIWSMAWHPLGHILVTGSNDHSTKFWARNKPGDSMKDRYNLNLLPMEGEDEEVMSSVTEPSSQLPGMGIDEDAIEQIKLSSAKDGIPGLDLNGKDLSCEVSLQERKGKYTFTKKIDKSFAAAWEGRAPANSTTTQWSGGPPPVNKYQENMPPSQAQPGLLGHQPPTQAFNKSLLGDAPAESQESVSGLLETPSDLNDSDPNPWASGQNAANSQQDGWNSGNNFNNPPSWQNKRLPSSDYGSESNFSNTMPNFNGPFNNTRNDPRGPPPRHFENNHRGSWNNQHRGPPPSRWQGPVRSNLNSNFRPSAPY